MFYDRYEAHNLLGRDLSAYLDQIYRRDAYFVVVFISEAYARKIWPKHEFRSILAGRVFGPEDYVLPVMLGNIELPGLPPTTAYIDASNLPPENVAFVLIKKPSASGVLRPHSEIIEGTRLVAVREKRFSIDRDVVGRHGYGKTFLFSTTTDLFVLAGRPHGWLPSGGSKREIEIIDLVTLDTRTIHLAHKGEHHYDDPELLTEADSPWMIYESFNDLRPPPFNASQILVVKPDNNGWHHQAGITRVVRHDSSISVYHDRLNGVVSIPLEGSLLDLAISADGMILGTVTLGEYFRGDPDYSDDLPSIQYVDFTIYRIQVLPSL